MSIHMSECQNLNTNVKPIPHLLVLDSEPTGTGDHAGENPLGMSPLVKGHSGHNKPRIKGGGGSP